MQIVRARPTGPADRESGFSLVEVVIAIAILGILSTASLGVYLSGLNSATTQQRRQVAIALANSAMEKAVATPIAGLTAGRGMNAVQTRWTANLPRATDLPSVAGVDTTYQLWDSAAPVAGYGTLPIFDTSNQVNGTKYTVDTLVGSCFQKRAAVGTQPGGPCTVTTGWPVAPATPTDRIRMIRVIVVVRWSAGAGCGSGACNYSTTTLLDSSSELTWNAP